MTQTLPKRNSRHTVLPHAAGVESRGPHRLGHTDAADLAARLRELALRAHRVVNEAGRVADGAIRGDLHELRAAILGLEADILNQDLHGLLPYVAALRQQVEAVLG